MANRPRSGFEPAPHGPRPAFQGLTFARVDTPAPNGARAEPAQNVEAEAAGFAQGLSAGREAARAEAEALKSRLVRSIADLASARHRLEADHAARLASAVRAVCRHVIGAETRTNPDVLAQWMSAAMARLDPDEPVEVHVNPTDVEWITPHVPPAVNVVTDAAVPLGGVSVVSRTQVTDIDPLGVLDDIFRLEHPCAP